VTKSLFKSRVVVEHPRAVAALPPALHGLDRTVEPRHEAMVGTRLELTAVPKVVTRRNSAPHPAEVG
jgi:hypothetical protein